MLITVHQIVSQWSIYSIDNYLMPSANTWLLNTSEALPWAVPGKILACYTLVNQFCYIGNYFHLCYLIFTAQCCASAVLAMALCPSLRPSACPSVTSRCSTKTAKRRITHTTPHDSPGTLVFWCQRSPQNSTGGTKCRWGGSKSATFDK